MAAEPKPPRNWETLDPNEQWGAALAKAREEESAARGEWQQATTHRLEREYASRFDATRERWWGALKILAVIGATILAGYAITFGLWAAWQGHLHEVGAEVEASTWAGQCILDGGRVVYEGLKEGQLLCVKDVVSTHQR